MVASRLGPAVYRRLHLHSHPPGSAVARLGLFRACENVVSRPGPWLVFMPVPVMVARLAEAVEAPISGQTVLGAMMVITAVFLLPSIRGWGLKMRHGRWNSAGFAAALAYVALTIFAHRVALARIHKFAELDHLQVASIGALPLPPSLWNWDGSVRSERGVYELRMDLADTSASDTDLLAHEHRYYPDTPPNSYIEEAKRLPEV